MKAAGIQEYCTTGGNKTMNYDEFRDTHDMEFHGKVYDIVLNVCQYRDKETKTSCIKAEVYDEESEGLRTIYGSCTEFKFKRKGSIEKTNKTNMWKLS